MKIFKDTFTTLQSILATITDIRVIDLWNEEIDQYREELPQFLPAIYIEFLPTTWNTIGTSKTQHGYTTIKIHIAQNIITDTASVDGTPLPTQTDTLKRFDLLEAVHNVLQDFKTIQMDALDCVATHIDHNHDGIIIDIIEYRTILKVTNTSTANTVYSNSVPLPDINPTGDINFQVPI